MNSSVTDVSGQVLMSLAQVGYESINLCCMQIDVLY